MKKIMTDEVKKHVKRMLDELETECVKGLESAYLQYEFFMMLYYFDYIKYEYDQNKFYKLLNKLQNIVCKKYKCVRYN